MAIRTALTAVLVLGLVAFTAPTEAMAAGATQQPISGTIALIEFTGGDVRATPGGILHVTGDTGVTEFTGDIAGIVTFFYKRVHQAADGSHLVSKGPFAGEVTWEDRTGVMSGMFTTECKPDTVPFSCDITMIGHGSGELADVKFRIKWGPGFFPFPYQGSALDPHGDNTLKTTWLLFSVRGETAKAGLSEHD